jgi:hypothetical protein
MNFQPFRDAETAGEMNPQRHAEGVKSRPQIRA